MSNAMNPDDSTGVQSFCYARGRRRWWRYLPLVFGFIFVYVILVRYDLHPLSSVWFPLLVLVAIADIIGIAILRAKAPREFQIRGQELLMRWPERSRAVPLREVFVNRPMSWLFSGATTLNAGGTTVVVFDDLEGYSELISLVTETKPSSGA